MELAVNYLKLSQNDAVSAKKPQSDTPRPGDSFPEQIVRQSYEENRNILELPVVTSHSVSSILSDRKLHLRLLQLPWPRR